MIPYSGSSGPDKTYYSATAVTPGNDYPFTTWHDNRFYAIIADVTSSKFVYDCRHWCIMYLIFNNEKKFWSLYAETRITRWTDLDHKRQSRKKNYKLLW